MGSKDTMGMSTDLIETVEDSAEVHTSKDMAKKGKFAPKFQKFDPIIGRRVDIPNEAGYEDPFVVDGIFSGSLIDGIKKKVEEMSHLQRFSSMKHAKLMVRFHSFTV